MESQTRPAADGGSPLLTREQAKALTDRVLALSTAEQTRVNIVSEWSGNTRFADASITTSGGITDTTLTITVTLGKRRASSSTNVLDDASLKRTIDLAIRLARLSPDDPELMPELGPQMYSTVNAYVRSPRRPGRPGRALIRSNIKKPYGAGILSIPAPDGDDTRPVPGHSTGAVNDPVISK